MQSILLIALFISSAFIYALKFSHGWRQGTSLDMHILHVVGARPNFMKLAPVLHALRKRAGITQTLVHTGQNYDANMSDVALQKRATVMITDSGGIQEETTFLGVPCLTLRENTERPITVSLGTNVLVGRDADMLREELHKILRGKAKRSVVPPLWDGVASERIADILQTSSVMPARA